MGDSAYKRGLSRVVALAASVTLVTSCSSGDAGHEHDHGSGGIPVVVTTEILADLISNVGGDRVAVSSIVPHGGDPHSYEPTPTDATKVVEAEAAFSNHLLLEDHSMIRLLDNNIGEGVPNIDLAQHAERYGARLMPLVEDVTLDVVWLGLAVRGTGPDRASMVRIEMTAMDGPGDLFVYVTDSLGVPEVYFDSSDGVDDDHATLPPGAHTHVNWAFTEPGRYDLTLQASLDDGEGAPEPLGSGTFTFAVGVDPTTVGDGTREVIDDGHADASVDLDTGLVFVCTAELSCADQEDDLAAEDAVIDVPNRALVLVPDNPGFSFLGEPGSDVWELPQAVLGKHVHGEIDPHLWLAVDNAMAYVHVMADTLISIDPGGADYYETNRDAYLEELEDLHEYVASQINQIPRENRKLVTTHDAFDYMAASYDMDIAGFVVPNPAHEPSAAEVRRLTETIRNLELPAVFVEPNLASRAAVLVQVASDLEVDVCQIYGDSFDENETTYIDIMSHNADELLQCLG